MKTLVQFWTIITPPVLACTNYDVAVLVWFTIPRNRTCPDVLLFIYK